MGFYIDNHTHQNMTYTNNETKMVEITRQEAEEIARNELKRKYPNDQDDLTIDISRTEEYNFGWTIMMFPKKYLETRDEREMLFGLGSFIVTRVGKIVYVPTNMAPIITINRYIEEWKATHGNN